LARKIARENNKSTDNFNPKVKSIEFKKHDWVQKQKIGKTFLCLASPAHFTHSQGSIGSNDGLSKDTGQDNRSGLNIDVILC
jgi:hypothetical protein